MSHPAGTCHPCQPLLAKHEGAFSLLKQDCSVWFFFGFCVKKSYVDDDAHNYCYLTEMGRVLASLGTLLNPLVIQARVHFPLN